MTRTTALAYVAIAMIVMSATLAAAAPSIEHRKQTAAAPAAASSAPSSKHAPITVPPFKGPIDPRIIKTPIHAADVPLTSAAEGVHAKHPPKAKAKTKASPAPHHSEPCRAAMEHNEAHTVQTSSSSEKESSLKSKARHVLDSFMKRIRDIRARFEQQKSPVVAKKVDESVAAAAVATKEKQAAVDPRQRIRAHHHDISKSMPVHPLPKDQEEKAHPTVEVMHRPITPTHHSESSHPELSSELSSSPHRPLHVILQGGYDQPQVALASLSMTDIIIIVVVCVVVMFCCGGFGYSRYRSSAI